MAGPLPIFDLIIAVAKLIHFSDAMVAPSLYFLNKDKRIAEMLHTYQLMHGFRIFYWHINLLQHPK